MVLVGGTLASVAAGPQRERTDIDHWNGSGYALVETHYAASNSLPLLVWEANDALAMRDYEQAITLYERALSDPSLVPWAQGTNDPALQESERDLLHAFSRFRLVVANAAAENEAGAEQWLETFSTYQTDSPFHEAAEIFMTRWLGNGMTIPCRAANGYAAEHLDTMVEPLNRFGYTGPQFTTDDICPF
jgi:hypothetical protein